MIEMLRKNLHLDKNWNAMSEHNLFLFACLLLLGLLYLGLGLLYSGSARKRFALAPLVHAVWTLAAVFLSWELYLEKLFLGAPFETLGLIGNPLASKTQLTEISPHLFSFSMPSCKLVNASIIASTRCLKAVP